VLPAIQPSTIAPTPTPAPNPTPVPQATGSEQEMMVQKFTFDTRLKPDFAKQCLEQNAWSYEKAMEAFTTLKVSIGKRVLIII
jgi:hypothetical protein